MKKNDMPNAIDRMLGGNKEKATISNTTEEAALDPQTTEENKTREELEEALKAHNNSKRGRPKKWEGNHNTDGESRTSLVIKDTTLAKLREISLRETLSLKEVVEASLSLAIESYEKKYGEIVPKDRTQKTARALFQ